MLLFHSGDQLFDQNGMVVTSVIQLDDKLLHVGMSPVHLSEQTNHLLGVQVFLGNADIKVFMIFNKSPPGCSVARGRLPRRREIADLVKASGNAPIQHPRLDARHPENSVRWTCPSASAASSDANLFCFFGSVLNRNGVVRW